MTAALNKPLNSQLYNLESDPYEMSDIADSSPDIIKQLVKDELLPWLKKTDDPWIEIYRQLTKLSTTAEQAVLAGKSPVG